MFRRKGARACSVGVLKSDCPPNLEELLNPSMHYKGESILQQTGQNPVLKEHLASLLGQTHRSAFGEY